MANATEVTPEVESAATEVGVKVPEYPDMRANPGSLHAAASMESFYDVTVPVWAELGRIELPIGELLKFGEGTVVRLSRSVSDSVDLVAQGTVLARGEVVVIDDCFAVRIKEVNTARRAS
ncbi:MAG: FliM/FliN family flagellar motor switch protein [Planctomycetota bacterium]|nr:FliM/FliN family flagellar motor switch protein [Planctomycetota bacterium]MDA1178030.1 FliM/FliN family flagellar motor switch protein [Planctomycetota bacterium]